LDSSLIQIWNSQLSQWENSDLTNFTYDSNNNLIESISKKWNGSFWINSGRSTQTYDVNNNLTVALSQRWQDGNWVDYIKVEYTYDGTALSKTNNVQANLIDETTQLWNGAEWINLQKQSYAYVPTFVEETKETITNYSLQQNYPNPFNPSTKISWQVPVAGLVTLKVYDVLGREVITLVNEELNAGKHEATFDAIRFSSGIYFYQLKAGDFIQTKKMILLR
jgi:hypothetical protein